MFYPKRRDARYCSIACQRQAARRAGYIFEMAVKLRDDLRKLIGLIDNDEFREHVYPLLFWLSSEMHGEIDRVIGEWGTRTDIAVLIQDAERRLKGERERKRKARRAVKVDAELEPEGEVMPG